jgi:hypothetical protein
MKLIVLLALLSGCALLSTGCATPAYSAKERDARISRIHRYEARQAVDDWDVFWLEDRPSHLTVWHVR